MPERITIYMQDPKEIQMLEENANTCTRKVLTEKYLELGFTRFQGTDYPNYVLNLFAASKSVTINKPYFVK